MSDATRVIVVGGGVIGLCSAYFLRQRGAVVTLIERGKVGQAASKGNAGWVTPVLSEPLPAPGVIGHGLRSMLHPDSPLYFRPAAVPRLMPWLVQFARYCRQDAHDRGVRALARLNERALPLYKELERRGLGVQLLGNGLLFCFMQASNVQHVRQSIKPMFEYGYREPRLLSGPEMRELEPSLSPGVDGGFLIEKERYLHPGTFTSLLEEALRGMGVILREATEVVDFVRDGSRVTAVETTSGRIESDQLLLAAGVWTGGLAKKLGVRLPIEAGKGYSFSVRLNRMPKFPLYLGEASVGGSPFGDRLRLAGTMEFSGVNDKLDRRRLDAIERSCQPYFSERLSDGRRLEEWTGMRPIAPDGLPVIGPLDSFRNVFIASGHSMLGITLGPATGDLVASQILLGETPEGFNPFLPSRFTSSRAAKNI